METQLSGQYIEERMYRQEYQSSLQGYFKSPSDNFCED
jgi:hypothetical protein